MSNKKDEDGYWFTTEKDNVVHAEDDETPKEACERVYKPKNKKFRQNASYREILKADKYTLSSKEAKVLSSAVFNMISSNRKKLEKYGECEIDVCTWNYRYTIKLYGNSRDYDYEILWREKI